jgi:CBS-domain-containing membrane protein
MGGATTVTMDDTLHAALRLMAVLDVRELPVVNGDDQRQAISMVSRKDIARAYRKEMERVRKPSHAGPHETKRLSAFQCSRHRCSSWES